MSRFFAADSDSETESESSGQEELQPSKPVSKNFQFSDDDEDVKRVVRSTKDKRYDELRTPIKKMKNLKKIKDMANILESFDVLTRAHDKAKKIVEKEGNPRFFIRCLVELEEFVSECWEDREGRKQMSKNNAKGLTTLRQKLRKFCRDFETDMAEYKKKPDEGEEVSEEEEKSADSSEDDGPSPDFFKKAAVSKPKAPKDDGESDDSDFPSDDSDDSDISSGEDYGDNPALRFLKKTGPADDKKETGQKRQVRRDKEEKKTLLKDSDDEGWEEVKGGAPLLKEKPKMFAKDTEINHEAVSKKLSEIVSARGKKGTDRTEMINMLTELNEISLANSLGPAMQAKILLDRISAVYDYNPNIATCMKEEMWNLCLDSVQELLVVLEENRDDMVLSDNVHEDAENLSVSPYRVRGCILTVTERMDEEFTKILQACDAHSTEYVDRLKDEQTVCLIISRLVKLLEGRSTTEETCRAYLRKISHLYYKFDKTYYTREEDIVLSEREMEKMCQYIHAKDNTDRIRTQAMLCHVYHHALHDRWYKARDLMMMSHLQDNIQHSDVPTQIMYNRTMVQLGLCAFRQGMIKDAHNCLVDIQSSGRAKELLAQGLLLQRQHERTAEQEKIEKRRQMPYHMHINLELLECVYLVSAMLMEIPYMAAHEFDARRRMISKNFHHVLRVSERQPLVGPPESMREHIVAASKAMKNGDWLACKEFIINNKMNTKVWELFYDKEKTVEMIVQKIQEESLRTYLFTYSSVYDSLSLATLADMFQLDTFKVHSIISKMIINEELMASLDEPTQTVEMHRTEPTRLQAMALQLSEKVSSLVENNEKIMEMKQGTYFYQNKGYDRGPNQDQRQSQQNVWRNKQNQQQRYGNRQDRQKSDRYYGGQKSDRYDRGNYGRGGYERERTY